MPWIINNNNEYEYVKPQVNHGDTLTSDEEKKLEYLKTVPYSFGSEPMEFKNFLLNECIKPITFNIEKNDGTKEVMTLSEDETRDWLSNHQDLMREAGREPGTHLMAFLVKNGVTVEDIELLRNEPTNPKCEKIREKFDIARKELFELVSCEDKRVLEEGELSVREKR